jgi:hypothetical protein
LACDRQFGQALQRHRVSALLLGIVAFLAHFGAIGYLLMHDADYWTDYCAGGLLGRFFKGLGSWFWVVYDIALRRTRPTRFLFGLRLERTKS